jgi:hypothetical protein
LSTVTATIATSSAPSAIQHHHWQEWLNSGIAPDLIALNLESLDDDGVATAGDAVAVISERLNIPVRRNAHSARRGLRGWWVAGVDPLNDYLPMVWGRFKPDADTPMFAQDGKQMRYRSPKDEPSRATFLHVPRRLWELAAERQDIPLTEDDLAHPGGYWRWVRFAGVPVWITEGEKKAACLISNGFPTIALPGATTGCRRATDNIGKHGATPLIPELQHFANDKRQIYICLDYETKQKNRKMIQRETRKMSENFRAAGCTTLIAQLPGPDKGVDDFIVNQGMDAFAEVWRNAISFAKWQRGRLSKLSYPPSLRLNQDKLGGFSIFDDPKFVAIKSPKGTGKTHWLAPLCQEAMNQGQRVLLITHRVQLGQELSRRLGVSYITEVRDTGYGEMLGFGICVDSMHEDSQARFKPEYWSNALVIVDEACQVAWHALSAETEIGKRRSKILGNLRTLLTSVLDPDSRGRLILADADLNDTTIEFFAGMAGFSGPAAMRSLNPFLIVNDWKPGPEAAWQVHHYEQQQPLFWYEALCEEVAAGRPVYVCTHSQKAKSKWGTRGLEEAFRQRFPEKRILRIDSQTIANPEHEAFGVIESLDGRLVNYDIVLVSPTLETGASIDVRGHFGSVWGCFQGVSPTDSVRQALARVREPVERHIWVTNFSRSMIGNGGTSLSALVRGVKKMAQWTGELLAVGIDCDSDEFINQAAFEAWAKFAAYINLCKMGYREAVMDGLRDEGHCIHTEIIYGDETDLKAEITEARDRVYGAEKTAICEAELISEAEAQKLDKKKELTEAEEIKRRRYRMHERYGIPVDDELIELDDEQYHDKIKLHFYLTLGAEFLRDKEKQQLERRFEQRETWLPTIFQGMFSTKVAFLQRLHVLELLDPEKQWDHDDPLINRVATTCRANAEAIRTVLKFTASERMSDIQIVQMLLSKIGTRLTCIKRPGSGNGRKRVYVWEGFQDPREAIYAIWIEREHQRLRELAEGDEASDDEIWYEYSEPEPDDF